MTRQQITRVSRFAVVGGSGVVVNLVVFQAALFLLAPTALQKQYAIIVANACGIIISIFTNFLLNDRWTWGDRVKGHAKDWRARLVKYYISASLAAAIQLAVTSVSYQWVWAGVLPDWNGIASAPIAALLSGIACGMLMNFVASHMWAFKDASDT